jgi:diguanylate cyclase (GGDEF)-like protein/PAS domain S-box-containing protein
MLDLVRQATQIDFSQYKEATLRRQVVRRQQALRLGSLHDYLTYLEHTPDEIALLQQSFLISVTTFFRDADVFDAFKVELGQLLASKPAGEALRLWVPGCATGEEVYSIAIVLAEWLANRRDERGIKIFATDIDQPAIDQARSGLYAQADLDGLEAPLLDRYFLHEAHGWRINPAIREMCVFSRHDLLRDPPFLRLDVVVCRNVLIYFQPQRQEDILYKFQYALNPGGLLVLGKSESVRDLRALFSPIDAKLRLYRRHHGTPLRPPMLATPTPIKATPTAHATPATPARQHDEVIQNVLLRAYAPPSILLNARHVPQHFHGGANRYLMLPDGSADFSITALCPPALRTEMSILLRRLQRGTDHSISGQVISTPVLNGAGDTLVPVRLHLRDLSGDGLDGSVLVSIEEQPVRTEPVPALIQQSAPEALAQEVARLHEELIGTREHLQAVIEAMDTANQELQSLNEEMQSAGEELQASNEELQTANEELQSTNEELTTINDELQNKTAQLSEAHDQLNNLQNSTQVSMVLVDRQLHITRFNALAARIFGLLPSDIGQGLLGVPCYLDLPELRQQISQTIASGRTLSLHVGRDATHYLMQITPYLTSQGDRPGAVLSFLDISELRRAERTAAEQEQRFRTIYNNAPTSIWQEDWRAVMADIEALRAEGVSDFERWFEQHPEFLDAALAKVQVLDVNPWTLAMFRAEQKTQLLGSLDNVFREAHTRTGLRTILLALANRQEQLVTEMQLNALDGQLLDILLSMSFPPPDSNSGIVLVNVIDVSSLKQTQRALSESESHFRQLSNSLPQLVWTCGTDGAWDYLSDSWVNYTGRPASQHLGAGWFEQVHPDDRAGVISRWNAAMARGEPSWMVLRLRRHDGIYRWFDTRAMPLKGGDGQIVKWFGSNTDITDQRAASELHARLATIVNSSQDAIIGEALDGLITNWNPGAEQLFGYSADEAIGQPSRMLSPPKQLADEAELLARVGQGESVAHFETVRLHKDGHPIDVSVALSPLRDAQGQMIGISKIARDISTAKRAEEEIRHLAYYDSLTRLPNRRLLLDRIRHAMAISERSLAYRALLFIDLDHFKLINDSLGHERGDQLLIETAQRLLACVRHGDTVARLGGDEFVLMLENLDINRSSAAVQVECIAHKIVEQLGRAYELGQDRRHCTPSIGISLFRGIEVSVDDLLKQTDLAMYQAKAAGRNGLRFFDAQMQASVDARSRVEAELRLALERMELLLHYQPQVNQAGGLIGAEALVRWQHPTRGLINPLEFIDVAESSGLIIELGDVVLDQACATLARWSADPTTQALNLSINLSARQFRMPDFVARIAAALDAHQAQPERLRLEITESLLLDDIKDTRHKMMALRQLGVGFALDDFGTGYSSLVYLRELPIDQIKIDRSFVHGMQSEANHHLITRAVIALGHSLGMSVIAEGVETERQWQTLLAQGCDEGQGFLFGAPVPLPALETLLQQGQRQR